MTDSAVAMKRALPRPHPARSPTMAPMLFDAPASALKTMISASPPSSVRLEPMRLATALVTSIEIPVKAK